MIYIVSGFMRSGTSMMMHALIAGGMDASWSEDRNNLVKIKSDEDYTPNKNGLYEIDLLEYETPNFPLKYVNKLIKVMVWGLPKLADYEYKIVLMKRHPEEIRQSYEAFFNKSLSGPFIKNYEKCMYNIIAGLEARKDVALTVFDYKNVVHHPQLYFNVLRHEGWPIDVDKCIDCIDLNLYRFQLEKLIIGI